MIRVRSCVCERVPESSHDIFKVWHLRREVCEFCVKYTMQMRERRVASYADRLIEYRLSEWHKNITVPKVSIIITSMYYVWKACKSCCLNNFNYKLHVTLTISREKKTRDDERNEYFLRFNILRRFIKEINWLKKLFILLYNSVKKHFNLIICKRLER